MHDSQKLATATAAGTAATAAATAAAAAGTAAGERCRLVGAVSASDSRVEAAQP